MSGRIVVEPSVLARTTPRFLALQTVARTLSRSYHVDLMDGKFTSTTSIGPTIVAKRKLSATTTVHLMVKDPIAWLPAVIASGCRQALIHAEIGQRAKIGLASFRAAGCKIGLALRVTTKLDILDQYRHLNWIHLMTGPIGRYGSAFDKKSLARIAAVRRRLPHAIISVDVGMNPRTIPLVVAAGANRIIVGSYLWSGDPRTRWSVLQSLVRSL